jgi:hypothetical protein
MELLVLGLSSAWLPASYFAQAHPASMEFSGL